MFMPIGPFGAKICQGCGVNMGQKPNEHVCNEQQYLSHQQVKWASEIRNKLEPDMVDYLSSKRGQFLLYLMKQGRI